MACPKSHVRPCGINYGDPMAGVDEHPFATYFDVHQGLCPNISMWGPNAGIGVRFGCFARKIDGPGFAYGWGGALGFGPPADSPTRARLGVLAVSEAAVPGAEQRLAEAGEIHPRDRHGSVDSNGTPKMGG